MNGLLIIDKPEGLTSHDVVSRLRRILGTRRIGHTGTLDPFATGVIVALVGKATRLAQFLDKDEKEYEALMRLGFETDTGDRTGEPRDARPARPPDAVSLEEIADVLAKFRGEIDQVPPMYSAKKVEGRKLYELARKGIDIEREAVSVTISKLELIGRDAPDTAAIRVACSAGTYIRTLAEDIGRELGCGAHLSELRRTRAGRFGLSRAVTLETLEKADAGDYLLPMAEAVAHLPQLRLNAARIEKARSGLSSRMDADLEQNAPVAMLSDSGELIAVGHFDASEKAVRPKVVLI